MTIKDYEKWLKKRFRQEQKIANGGEYTHDENRHQERANAFSEAIIKLRDEVESE
jgi:hypothetical protein